MAQRERHELNLRVEHFAGRLWERKAILIAFLVVIAAACGMGLSAVSGADSSGAVEIERGSSETSSGSTDAKGDGKESSTPVPKKADVAYVDIDGAVVSPGVYRLSVEDRISDAIEAAGGLSEDADVTSVNRATKVIDGQKIHIPRTGEAQASDGVGASSTDTSSSDASTGLVNINTAGSSELETLPGVGPSTAQAIIDDRTQNGAFSSVDDLMRVSGIGEKKFEKIKGKICI